MSESRKTVKTLQRRVVDPLVKRMVLAGASPQHALLETVGRSSGQPRQTPVGNGLASDGRTFWIVTEYGRRAHYVRNIEVNPRVRVRVGRRWREGLATVLYDDDALHRQRTMPKLNAAIVRAIGTELLTVRVDLDPLPAVSRRPARLWALPGCSASDV